MTLACCNAALVLCAALVISSACSTGESSAPAETDGLLAELSRVELPRTIVPRLSIAQRYLPCSDTTDGLARCSGIASLPLAEHIALQGRLDSAVRTDPSAGALHALALIGLTWNAHRRDVVDTSIAYLQAASQLSAKAAALVDLAAARMVRAQHDDDPRDLFAAIEAADSAIQVEPLGAAAFNAALALERMQLRREANSAWVRFRTLEKNTSWSREAETRARANVQERNPDPKPNSSRDSIRAFARRWPHRARMLAFDQWLGEWGAAVQGGRESDAARSLEAASIVGSELAQLGGDLSVLDAVASAKAAAGDRRLGLARAHSAYMDGQRAALSLDPVTADGHFRAALAVDPPRPLRDWATLGRAIALVSGGDSAIRARLLGHVVAATDSVRYPTLLGRARWALGTIAIRSARYGEARAHYESAIPLFQRSRELEHVGALTYLSGETLLNVADRLEGYRRMLRALAILQEQGPSVWLHNALILTSRFVEGDGWARAALRFSNEDVRVTESFASALSASSSHVYHAEALVARTRLMWRLRPESTQVAVRRAAALLDSAPSGFATRWVGAQLSYARASILADREPRAAVAAADSVIATFDPAAGAGSRNAARHLGALLIRARAYAAAGSSDRAIADLDAAVDLIDSVRVGISREGNRQSLAEATREVIDTLVGLRLARGDVTGALRIVERGRSAVRFGEPLPAHIRARPGRPIMALRVVSGGLIAWVVTDTGTSLVRTPVDTRQLATTIRRLRAGLERRVSEQRVRGDLVWLHDAIIRPIASHLRSDSGAITVVPDGILSSVPLAALYDRAAGKYWIEEREIRVESSVRDALESQRSERGTRVAGTRLLIADPAFDTAVYRSLRRLPHAAAEVAAIDSIYAGRAVIISDEEATSARVRDALRDASLVHYAGHAISDEARPEESFLLLSNDDDTVARGRLTADEIRELRPRRLDLVVLAACETLGPASERSTGFRGLAASLRRAGAKGVVGSLWRVDDQSTRELMIRLHSAYARDPRGPAALRSAQVELIRNTVDPRLRSPAAWAGFQYVGN